MLVLGLVIAIGAFVTGPSTTAVQIRSGLNHAIGWLRRGGAAAGLRTGSVGPWVHANRVLLRIVALAVAVLVFVFLDRPSGLDILRVALGLVIVLGIIQFLDQPAEPAEPGSAVFAAQLAVTEPAACVAHLAGMRPWTGPAGDARPSATPSRRS